VPTVIDQESWELAQQQLRLNRERASRNNKQHDYLLKGLLVCAHCQLRMFGNAGAVRRRRYRCSRQETLRLHPEPCAGRSVLAEAIEELVWQSVSELLRDPQLLLEQYQLRQDQSYGTPEQQEQQRLTRKLSALEREEQRMLDAYQASVIELPELKERCARIAQERARLEARLKVIERQQQSQQQQAALSATMEEFCRNISAALDDPSFETKQRILRLVVDRIELLDDQITIKHMIPIPDVQLRRQPHSSENLR
jgi:site-specific DNA recombinase